MSVLILLYSAPAGPRGPGPRGSGLHCVDSEWSTELPGTSGDVNHHTRAATFWIQQFGLKAWIETPLQWPALDFRLFRAMSITTPAQLPFVNRYLLDTTHTVTSIEYGSKHSSDSITTLENASRQGMCKYYPC